MELIDKATVVAEIKRRKEINKYRDTNDSLFEDEAILSFINALEVKEVNLEQPEPYFYCKYGGVMPLCSDCKRNHLNSKYKTEEIETWMVPTLHCTRQCFSYIQQKPIGWSMEEK